MDRNAAEDDSVRIDRNGLVVLDRGECVRLLQSRDLGRVAVNVNALPAIFPVNYVVADGAIILRSSAGTKLDAALRHTVVAFEVDSFGPSDPDTQSSAGWSVLVVGVASEVVEPEAVARARALPLTPWTGHPTDHFIRIEMTDVSGRRATPR